MKKHPFISLLLLLISALSFYCAHLKEAHRSFEENDFRRTIMLCKKALMTDSTDVEATLLLSKSYRALDSLDLALSTIKDAYRLQPESPQIQAEYTQVYIDLGDRAIKHERLSQALELYRSAESMDPKHGGILQRMANLYYDRGELDEAKAMYERLLSTVSDSTAVQSLAVITERVRKAGSLYAQGVKAYDTRRYRTAKSYFTKSLKEKADQTNARYYLSLTEGHLLFNNASKKMVWDAIAAFGKAAAIRSEIGEPHFYMARAYEKKDPEEFVNAIEAYDKALQIEPEGPFASACKKKIRELKARKDKLDKFWGRKK